jgi:hypothetical protein
VGGGNRLPRLVRGRLLDLAVIGTRRGMMSRWVIGRRTRG